MTNTIWLLQGNMKNKTGLVVVEKSLTHHGYSFICENITPFSSDLPVTLGISDTDNVICWGPSFVPRVSYLKKYTPGIWFDPGIFKWNVFKKHWGHKMMSSDGKIFPFREVKEKLHVSDYFIRPNEDLKYFDGGVYTSTTLPKLSSNAPKHFEVMLATPRKIISEWRFFIVAEKPIAASSYRINNEPNIDGYIPVEAKELAEHSSKEWSPADVFCLDIGFDGAKYGIIEANCFNASRFYGANSFDIVRAVTEFTKLNSRQF